MTATIDRALIVARIDRAARDVRITWLICGAYVSPIFARRMGNKRETR